MNESIKITIREMIKNEEKNKKNFFSKLDVINYKP